jgi:hypothetical protein
VIPPNFEHFNFLYSQTDIGKSAVEKLAKHVTLNPDKKIILNVGLSGAGKTFLIIQLAVQNKAFVLFYDCSRNASKLGTDIKLGVKALDARKIEDYENFATDLEIMMMNFTLANAFAMLQMLKRYQISPCQFLRYLENGGQNEISKIHKALCRVMTDITYAAELKTTILEEIRKLTPLPIVEAWDEAGLLTQWAANRIPFSNAPGNPKTTFDGLTLQHAGSAFTVACRIARLNNFSPTIFCGTALRLTKIENDVSGDLKNRTVYLQHVVYNMKKKKFLTPWSQDLVRASLQEDSNFSIPSSIDDTITYCLQGRPRLSATFKNKLYEIKQEFPKLDTPTSCLQYKCFYYQLM